MKRWQLQFSIPSSFLSLSFLRRLFLGLSKQKRFQLGPQDCFRLTHILIEAYNNAVVHAHRNRQERWVDLSVVIEQKKVLLQIGDSGRGWSRSAMLMPAPTATHGRGLALIKAFGGTLKCYRTKTKNWVQIDYKRTI